MTLASVDQVTIAAIPPAGRWAGRGKTGRGIHLPHVSTAALTEASRHA